MLISALRVTAQENNEYELKCAVFEVADYFGIPNYATFIQTNDKKWMKITRFDLAEVSEQQIKEQGIPKLVIYSKLVR